MVKLRNGGRIMEYEMNCEGCKKELRIKGAYLGLVEDAWCEECGFWGENL